MNSTTKIITPETHPHHAVVGQHWKARGIIYFCDSYDRAIGFWMAPIDGQAVEDSWGLTTKRTNVSERAIGRTFHACPDPSNTSSSDQND